MDVRRIVLLVVMAMVGAGCGSSGLHSTTHVYSVGQVEAAFAAHGIQLHKVERHPSQAVALDGSFGRSHYPIFVHVAATVRLANPFRMFPSLRLSRGPITGRRHGNVVLIFRMNVPTGAIDAALADLH
jgi:hypothetical protein